MRIIIEDWHEKKLLQLANQINVSPTSLIKQLIQRIEIKESKPIEFELFETNMDKKKGA